MFEESQGRGWSSRDVSREVVPSESFFQPGPQDFVASGAAEEGWGFAAGPWSGFDIKHRETKIQVLKGRLHLGTESSWSHSLLLAFSMSWA